MVSPELEISRIDRDPAKDQFLLLACGGIFDVMSTDEVCSYVHDQLTWKDNLEGICSSLIDKCLDHVSLHRTKISLTRIDLVAALVVPECGELGSEELPSLNTRPSLALQLRTSRYCSMARGLVSRLGTAHDTRLVPVES